MQKDISVTKFTIALLQSFEVPLITVFHKPMDYPTINYVARLYDLNQPTMYVGFADTLKEIRAMIPGGMMRFQRDPKDAKSVVETWI